MMITPVALASADWGSLLSTAGTTTLLGMVTIFAVLALLWGAIEIMHRFLHREEKNETAKVPSSAIGNPDDAAIAAAIAASLAAMEDDGATVAAITAAITAMRAETGETSNFRVVSFKRVGRAGAHRR